MDILRITSCLGDNTFPAVQAVAGYLSHHLHRPVEFVNDISWQERERQLDAGQIHLGWICGLLYVWKADLPHPILELLAAPVMLGRRYQNRPIYFSDVVVRRDSPYHTFAGLRGALWAYNEPRSYSGYALVLHHLNVLAESPNFFGGMVESGTHLNSLEMVINGRADIAAIDSTILDHELTQRPGLADQIRVIESLGPSPVPPWVVSQQLPEELRERLRQIVLGMHNETLGRSLLTKCRLSRFVPVTDTDYDSIREMRPSVE